MHLKIFCSFLYWCVCVNYCNVPWLSFCLILFLFYVNHYCVFLSPLCTFHMCVTRVCTGFHCFTAWFSRDGSLCTISSSFFKRCFNTNIWPSSSIWSVVCPGLLCHVYQKFTLLTYRWICVTAYVSMFVVVFVCVFSSFFFFFYFCLSNFVSVNNKKKIPQAVCILWSIKECMTIAK